MLNRKPNALDEPHQHRAEVSEGRHDACILRSRQSHSARRQRIGFARTAEPGTATRYWWRSAPAVTM
jgi:hypothetical protein